MKLFVKNIFRTMIAGNGAALSLGATNCTIQKNTNPPRLLAEINSMQIDPFEPVTRNCSCMPVFSPGGLVEWTALFTYNTCFFFSVSQKSNKPAPLSVLYRLSCLIPNSKVHSFFTRIHVRSLLFNNGYHRVPQNCTLFLKATRQKFMRGRFVVVQPNTMVQQQTFQTQ